VNEVRNFGIRVRTAEGEPFATVYIYGANLPATLLALVAQGDRGMVERMARLAEPGRRGARIQESARDGAVLVSKALIERLDPEYSKAIGIDPDTASYCTVAELPAVTEKAVRDAGAIPVTEVPCERS
jgi:hypothetical protein